MSALNTTFEEVTHEEVTREEVTYTPEVYEIKWGKKVHPNGLVAFIAKLHDAHEPLNHVYIRVYTDLIYSFLREHEDKDVLIRFGCSYRLGFYFKCDSECTRDCLCDLLSRTYTSKTNTPFVKLGECEVEGVVSNLLKVLSYKARKYELNPDEFNERDFKRVHPFGNPWVTGFYIIFKLKEKEDTSEEISLEENIFEEGILEEDIPEVININWEKKVHPNGLVTFITDLDDYLRPLHKRDYFRVYTDLIYSFLREHEDKDVLMCFACSYRLKFHHGIFDYSGFDIRVLTRETRIETLKTNTRFVKIGESEVEEAVEKLLGSLDNRVTEYEIGVEGVTEDYRVCLGITRFSIIFCLKEKEEPHIVN